MNNPGPTLSDFGHDPLWITIIKAVAIFVFLMLGVLLGVWTERKLISRMQHRYGPTGRASSACCSRWPTA